MNFYVFIIAIMLALITAGGDFLVKKGALHGGLSGNWWLIAGALVYALTAFGWYYILKHIKLSSSVVIYSLSLLIIVVLISVFYFKERISPAEYLGIALAMASIVILYRFA